MILRHSYTLLEMIVVTAVIMTVLGYVGGYSRSTQHSTYCCTHGVSHKGLVEILHVAIIIYHTGTVGHTDKGADGVEHIDEQEGEYHNDHINGEDIVPLKLPEDGFDGGRS